MRFVGCDVAAGGWRSPSRPWRRTRTVRLTTAPPVSPRRTSRRSPGRETVISRPSAPWGRRSSRPRSTARTVSATARSIRASGRRSPSATGRRCRATDDVPARQRSRRPELQRVPHHRQPRARGRRPSASAASAASSRTRSSCPSLIDVADSFDDRVGYLAGHDPGPADGAGRRGRLQRPLRQPALPVRRRRRRAAGQGDDRGPAGAPGRRPRRRPPGTVVAARHPRRRLRLPHQPRRRQRRARRSTASARRATTASGRGSWWSARSAARARLLDARLRPRRHAVPLRHPAGRGRRRRRRRGRRRRHRRGDRWPR